MTMVPYVVAILGVVVATLAHGRFLASVPQVVPLSHRALWLTYEGGTAITLALSVLLSAPGVAWLAAATACLGAVGGSLALRSIAGRAAEAEVGRSVLRATHVDPATITASERSLAAWRADLERRRREEAARAH